MTRTPSSIRPMVRQTILLFILLPLAFQGGVTAQTITQTVKGLVIDRATSAPLPGATVVIVGSNPMIGAASDIDGKFTLKNVPVGRYSLTVSFLGYETLNMDEVLVSSGKEVVLNISLQEVSTKMNEVVITAGKGRANNSMSTISARQFSVEEAARYAGGYDDPARLASSFAGVSGSLGNNGIVIRGNAPKGLLWQMEGMPISDPSHFANLQVIGAGALTALSSQMLANSDFYTGAFPADYGNAMSGVFDIKLRNGNPDKRESTFQLGIIGIDAASEGPFIKGKKSTYVFNYRYSTLSLLAPILPAEMGAINYQDLSFKMSFPTKKSGTFSLWGIGTWDRQGREALSDPAEWESDIDRQEMKIKVFMAAVGLNHKLFLGKNTYISTTLSPTGYGVDMELQQYNGSMNLAPLENINNTNGRIAMNSFVNHRFGTKHTNKTGFTLSRLNYDNLLQQADSSQSTMITYVDAEGSSLLSQAFTQSRYEITSDLSMVAGLHMQYMGLTKSFSLEPRLSFSWEANIRNTFCLSYGLHSQAENLNFYLARQSTPTGFTEPNRSLGFSKAHHLVLSWQYKLTEHTSFKLEPYFQSLYNIPVVPNSAYSMINLDQALFFDDSLVNGGTGKNYGLDMTLERYLSRGFYYLGTVSLFVSKYTGSDDITRNSRFNRNYVVNLLAGKEWVMGKSRNKILNVNGKLNLMGGEWLTPLDMTATNAQQEIVEDMTKAFTEREKPAQILSLSLSYRINHAKYAGTWSFSFINVLGYEEFGGYRYDKLTQTVVTEMDKLVIPNVAYKIEF